VAIGNRDGFILPTNEVTAFFKIALVEIIEGSLLAPLDVFVAR
jgi:hypothetical protein